jgi:hypothetical protein
MHLIGFSHVWLCGAAALTFAGLSVAETTPPSTVPPANLPIPAKPGEETQAPAPKIPADLLGDEHVREEFGVNDFTTPSIRKLFEMLDGLGKLPYDQLQRPISKKTSADRTLISLELGSLIADGFLIVQCEKIEAMEDVGRALIKHAKVLGTGQRMNRHAQSLLDHSLNGAWDNLRGELSRTQADVEAEMVELRDVDIAHLVSLGGWIRAFEIATKSVQASYTPEKTQRLVRPDIAAYYQHSLEQLNPALKKHGTLVQIRAGLDALIQQLPAAADGQPAQLTEAKLALLAQQAAALSTLISSGFTAD